MVMKSEFMTNAVRDERHHLSLSIVIPCYNEEHVLEELFNRVLPVAEKEAGNSYELILIDDGSKDATWSIIESKAKVNPRVVAVKLSRNHGHQLALTAGLSLVQGEQVLVLDADLQDPPELLPAMRRLMHEEQADVVYGKRRKRDGESLFKKLSATMFYRVLAGNVEIEVQKDSGDFKLMSRRIADMTAQMPERDRFIRGMVAWLGYKQVPIEYDRDARFAGQSKYPLRQMLRLARSAFMGFSMMPLRIAGKLSIIMFILLILFAIYTIYSWIVYDTVAGWTSLALAVTGIGAIQLLILAIMSEYIGKIYMETKNRPLFMIDRVERLPVSGFKENEEA